MGSGKSKGDKYKTLNGEQISDLVLNSLRYAHCKYMEGDKGDTKVILWYIFRKSPYHDYCNIEAEIRYMKPNTEECLRTIFLHLNPVRCPPTFFRDFISYYYRYLLSVPKIYKEVIAKWKRSDLSVLKEKHIVIKIMKYWLIYYFRNETEKYLVENSGKSDWDTLNIDIQQHDKKIQYINKFSKEIQLNKLREKNGYFHVYKSPFTVSTNVNGGI